MAKLKYDRPINIGLRNGQNVTIPNDEVWKITTKDASEIESTKLYGGGYSINSVVASGIAFKHVEE